MTVAQGSAAKAERWADRGWYVAVEYRADKAGGYYLDMATRISQSHPGYSKLVDPSRNVIYRNIYRAKDMRLFWELWSYLGNWPEVKVFVCGEEVPRETVGYYNKQFQPPKGA